jgi:hypothetical protein
VPSLIIVGECLLTCQAHQGDVRIDGYINRGTDKIEMQTPVERGAGLDHVTIGKHF